MKDPERRTDVSPPPSKDDEHAEREDMLDPEQHDQELDEGEASLSRSPPGMRKPSPKRPPE